MSTPGAFGDTLLVISGLSLTVLECARDAARSTRSGLVGTEVPAVVSRERPALLVAPRSSPAKALPTMTPPEGWDPFADDPGEAPATEEPVFSNESASDRAKRIREEYAQNRPQRPRTPGPGPSPSEGAAKPSTADTSPKTEGFREVDYRTAVMDARGLSLGARYTGVAIVRHCWQQGEMFARMELVAEWIGLSGASRKQATKYVAELVEAGFLVEIGKAGRAYRYRLAIP